MKVLITLASFLVTVVTAQQCTTVPQDVQRCVTELDFAGLDPSGFCAGNCVETITNFYADCSGAVAAAVRQSLQTACGGGNGGQTCTRIPSDVQQCVTNLGRAVANPNSFCSGSCVATITDFYADCSGAAADAVRQLLQTVCGGGNGGQTCIDIPSDVQQCVTNLGRAEANPNSFCSGSCVATIMDFYADCSGAAADGVRQLLQTVCGGGNGGQTCINIPSDMQQCVTNLGTAVANPTSFCSESCISTITDFYADCSGAAADAVRQSLETVCPNGNNNSGSAKTYALPGAVLLVAAVATLF